MNINDLYTFILADAGLVVDSEGHVSVNNKLFNGSDKNDPVLVEGKRLVLPTYSQLTSIDGDTKIRFHPLSENLLRGESVIVTKLRSLYSVRLNFTFAVAAKFLLDLCASVNKHKMLNPDQSEVLRFAPNCDETTVIAFNNLITKLLNNEAGFVRFYLKRAGIVRDEKYSRAGIVSFPFFEELQKIQDTYYGVKLRKKDRESIISICKFILKDIDKPEAYNRGSNSDIAPFLDALMKTFLGVAAELNDVLVTYENLDEDLKKLQFSCDWQETFSDLSKISREIKTIPPQAGSEGEARKVDMPSSNSQQNVISFTPGTINQQPVQAPQVHVPVMNNQQQQPSASKTDFASLMAMGSPQVQQQVVYVPVQQPMQMMQQPVMIPPSLMPQVAPGQYMPQGTQFSGGQPQGLTPNQVLAMGGMSGMGMMGNGFQGGQQQMYPQNGFNPMMQQQQMYGQQMQMAPGAPRSASSLPTPMMNPYFNNGFNQR